ncbi:hypothetical protein Bbelb_109450 [Branchiostoma belcheri]|nr:hypothetical protein Bbelb_109450 [Branchiostoma belcheri]
MSSPSSVWSSSTLSHQTKLRLYNSLVLSILLYGAETWTLTAAQERRLDAFDSKCQRRILGIRWHDRVSNDALRLRTNQLPLSCNIRSARLRLFGHIVRSEPPLELGALLREPPPPNWSRPRGRPRRNWHGRWPGHHHRLGSSQRQAGLEDNMQRRYAPNPRGMRT